jgi:uncharacterized protein (TIGR00661 family)
VNILYGVPGEGLGHATRSKVVIGHFLAQGHQVQVVSSSRAYTMLAAAYSGRVYEIRGFYLAYNGLAVSRVRTAALTLRTAPRPTTCASTSPSTGSCSVTLPRTWLSPTLSHSATSLPS